MKLFYPKYSIGLTKSATIILILLCFLFIIDGYRRINLGLAGTPVKYFFVYRGFYGVMIHIALFLMLCCCAMVLKIMYERIAIFLGAAGALFYGLSPLFFFKTEDSQAWDYLNSSGDFVSCSRGDFPLLELKTFSRIINSRHDSRTQSLPWSGQMGKMRGVHKIIN